MTYFDPESQAEVHRRQICEEMQTIHLQNKATHGRNLFSRGLALLGSWMIARGEKLRVKNSMPQAYYTELHKKPAHR